MSSNKDWIDIFQALLTPVIAIGGLGVAIFQWRTNEKKRQNDLFDRRYALYQRIEKWWLATADSDAPPPDIEDLVPVAQEVEFLFDKNLAKHIISLEGKRHTGSPFFPNEDFFKPFRRYLILR